MHHLAILDFGFWIFDWNPKSKIQNRKLIAGVAQLVERQPSKLNVASSSLVSRSISFLSEYTRPSSSGVERILGKDEVSGSNPDLGSRLYDNLSLSRSN